jgi:Conjugal transfer protein
MRRPIAILLSTTLAGCSSTGVPTSQTYVPANLIKAPTVELTPPVTPALSARLKGAAAIEAGRKGSVVVPTDRDVEGVVWRIADISSLKVYRVPTAPLAPTTILLPATETLSNAVSGSTGDFTIATAVSGNRAAVTVMPNCANPKSQRFDTVGAIEGYAEEKPPLQPCSVGIAKATFLTSGGVYNFEFQVNDYTAVAVVEVNHAPPPKTNVGRPAVPFPDGRADPLRLVNIGKYAAPWMPLQAWADPYKLVVSFAAPLPTWPALYAGKKGEQVVNYRVIEAGAAVYFVTERRVTEAQLRIEDEVVQITAAVPQKAGDRTTGRRKS